MSEITTKDIVICAICNGHGRRLVLDLTTGFIPVEACTRCKGSGRLIQIVTWEPYTLETYNFTQGGEIASKDN